MSSLSRQRALRVFAEHVARHPAPDDSALDELCRAHADLEAYLRRIARERAAVAIEGPQVAIPDPRALGLARTGRPRTGPGRYVVLGEVARGGMGVILRVWDFVLERPLALKMLDASGARADGAAESRARFLSEARLAARLQHPGIVPIHDLGVDEHGRVYFTMPLFEGCTLEEVFELARTGSQDWTLARALGALAAVCEVVACAHAHEVIHRDLKPSNVIVGESGAVHVLDWGLAKSLDGSAREPEPRGDAQAQDAPAEESGRTLDGTVAGTPPWMAPEQAEGRLEEVSFRADVYALGAMLYRLLAGRAPYAPRREREEPESPARILELIRRGAPTPLQRIAPEAPAELIALCERAMARDPARRHASAEALARDLRAFLAARTDTAAADAARASAGEGAWWR